jgi:FkbM family methyltransferase
MRRVIGWIIQLIGRLKLPMGLRMMRALARLSPDHLVDLIRKEKDDEYTYRAAIDTVFGNGLAFGFEFEPELELLARRLITSKSVVIDAGCNIGTFCIPLARHVARIIAVDANPRIVNQAQTNAGLNSISNIDFIVAAVGERTKFTNFFVDDDRNDISSLSEVWVKQFASGRRITVPMLTLENLLDFMGIEQIDLLKIDVENYSGAVIRGLERMLPRVAQIIAEDSEDLPEAKAWLIESGFLASQPLKELKGLPPHSSNTWLFSRKDIVMC